MSRLTVANSLRRSWGAVSLPGKFLVGAIVTNNKIAALCLIADKNGNLGILDMEAYRALVQEAKAAGLCGDLHVYARIASYLGPGLTVHQELPGGTAK